MSNPTEAADFELLLERWKAGDASAFDELLPRVYDQLRRVAQRLMGSERSDHTLQATALVHETYVRLIQRDQPNWQNRAHFFAVCALAMRRVLIDHGRRRTRRDELYCEIKLQPEADWELSLQRPDELIALDDALERLSALDDRKAQIVQLRFFGGLTLEEVAQVLAVSQATVVRDWRFARAWMEKELRPVEQPG